MFRKSGHLFADLKSIRYDEENKVNVCVSLASTATEGNRQLVVEENLGR